MSSLVIRLPLLAVEIKSWSKILKISFLYTRRFMVPPTVLCREYFFFQTDFGQFSCLFFSRSFMVLYLFGIVWYMSNSHFGSLLHVFTSSRWYFKLSEVKVHSKNKDFGQNMNISGSRRIWIFFPTDFGEFSSLFFLEVVWCYKFFGIARYVFHSHFGSLLHVFTTSNW